MHIIYLHGFASSPGSTKANLLRSHFVERGASYHVPDLNAPSFEQLMLSAMLERVAATIRGLPDEDDVVLIGSSMGGLTALHFYDRYRHAEAQRLSQLVLLAPALDFMENRAAQRGADWRDKWQQQGSMPFYNYATSSERPVHYGLIEDIAHYDSFGVQVDVPTLIYHGKSDQSVNPQQSVRFAAERDQVTLHLLNDDHQLLDRIDMMLRGILAFLNLVD